MIKRYIGLFLAGLFWVNSALATNSAPISEPDAFYETAYATVLSEAYSDKKRERRWVSNNDVDYETPDWQMGDPWWLDDWLIIIANIGVFFKTVLLLVLAGIVYVIVRYRQRFVALLAQVLPRQFEAKIAVNPAIYAQDTLPAHADIGALVAQLLAEGKYLPALSLLYRATLRILAQVHDLPIIYSTTEQQCLQLLDYATSATVEERAFLLALVQAWQHSAYGKTAPNPDSVKQLWQAWCQQYATTGGVR